MTMPDKLTALAFNCSLKSSSGEPSSTQVLLDQLTAALKDLGVECKTVRAVDHDIKPGVSADEGNGDAWPSLRARLMASDIVIIGTPIWLGQPCSVAKRVMERMDAFLDEKDDRGRMPTYGKVGMIAVVGNEDGAHHTIAELSQALTEVGFTVPPGAGTYWVGEAMGSKEYKSFKSPPEALQEWTPMLASNAAHLARLLKVSTYPGKT
jgi:multimeric flavodoxin WrbA